MKKKLKNIIEVFMNILLMSSLSVGGFYTAHNTEFYDLLPYQIAMCSLLISCVYLYQSKESWKDVRKDIVQDLFTSIKILFITAFLSKSKIEYIDVKSIAGVFAHWLVVYFYVKFIAKRVLESGKLFIQGFMLR